jgi:hypothetical protein
VSTKWKQNAATLYRENETIWQQTVEKVQEALPIGDSAAKLFGTVLVEVTDTKALIFVPSCQTLVVLERRLCGHIQNAMKGILGRSLDLQFVSAS